MKLDRGPMLNFLELRYSHFEKLGGEVMRYLQLMILVFIMHLWHASICRPLLPKRMRF